MSQSERETRGLAGRQWILSDESMMSAKHMCDNFIKHINICLEKWTPRKRYALYKIEEKKKITNPGIVI